MVIVLHGNRRDWWESHSLCKFRMNWNFDLIRFLLPQDSDCDMSVICVCAPPHFFFLFLMSHSLSLSELMSRHATSYKVWCSVKGCSGAVTELKLFTSLRHRQNQHSARVLSVGVCLSRSPFLSFNNLTLCEKPQLISCLFTSLKALSQ